MGIIDEFTKALRPTKKAENTSYSAVVSKVDDEGVVWVFLAGSANETPTVSTASEIQKGDTVTVEWRNNKLHIVGNNSNPAVGAERVNRVARDATRANQVAAEAIKGAQIAANTNQFFWHTQSGTDTGAHITEIPRRQFLADPTNGGGNLLARSNGVAIRDGLDELAIFGADGARIGKEDGKNLFLGSDYLLFREGSAEKVVLGSSSNASTGESAGTMMFYSGSVSTNTAVGVLGAIAGTQNMELYSVGGLTISANEMALRSTNLVTISGSAISLPRLKKDSNGYSNMFQRESAVVFSSTSISAGAVNSGTKSITVSSDLEILSIIGYSTDSGDINVDKLYISASSKGNQVTLTYNVKNVGTVARTTSLAVYLLCVKVGS